MLQASLAQWSGWTQQLRDHLTTYMTLNKTSPKGFIICARKAVTMWNNHNVHISVLLSDSLPTTFLCFCLLCGKPACPQSVSVAWWFQHHNQTFSYECRSNNYSPWWGAVFSCRVTSDLGQTLVSLFFLVKWYSIDKKSCFFFRKFLPGMARRVGFVFWTFAGP